MAAAGPVPIASSCILTPDAVLENLGADSSTGTERPGEDQSPLLDAVAFAGFSFAEALPGVAKTTVAADTAGTRMQERRVAVLSAFLREIGSQALMLGVST